MAKFSSRKRILVYQLGTVGDTVITIPALRVVRQSFGVDAEIVLLHDQSPGMLITPADLLDGGAEVDRFLQYEIVDGLIKRFLVLSGLCCRLRREKFSVVVYLAPGERTGRSVRRDEWFFWACGIPVRIGFHSFPDSALYPKDEDGYPKPVMHESCWRLERLKRDGLDVPVKSALQVPFLRIPLDVRGRASEWLASRRRYPERQLVAICPGAKQPANIWPLHNFMEIGRRLVQLNKYELVVVGGVMEREAGDKLVATWRVGINAAGQLTLKDSAAVLGRCEFAVGLDTGTTHLAAAMGTRCVGIYGGREHAGRWDPLGTGHIVLRNKVPCAGCRMQVCPIEGHPCMTGIDVEMVWAAVLQMANSAIS